MCDKEHRRVSVLLTAGKHEQAHVPPTSLLDCLLALLPLRGLSSPLLSDLIQSAVSAVTCLYVCLYDNTVTSFPLTTNTTVPERDTTDRKQVLLTDDTVYVRGGSTS